MLVRIVKLTFKRENIASFEKIFEASKDGIRHFDGCSFLELYQDSTDSRVFFTYSYWSSAKNLENYRNSDFFKNVWKKTKSLFDAKPEAWSVDKKETLK